MIGSHCVPLEIFCLFKKAPFPCAAVTSDDSRRFDMSNSMTCHRRFVRVQRYNAETAAGHVFR